MTKPTKDEVRAARSWARQIFALGGPDYRSMTDEELVAHVNRHAEQVQNALNAWGASAERCAETLRDLGKAFGQINLKPAAAPSEG